MANVSRSFPELERLLESPFTSKKELGDLVWLVEHPENEHRVVGIREFIESPEYLNCGGECWASIVDDLEALFSGDYDEAVFCEAIGAGKSFKSSLIIVYMVYRVLCLKNPQVFFGLATGSGIVFINMSVRAEQSKKVVFGEIKARVDNSPWFRRYYPPDPNTKSELRFPKGVTVIPGNSKESFPLGFNVLGGVMDEAAFYTDTDTNDVAESIFNALHNRIKNRFGKRGLLVMISSPRYVDDFIERKMRESQTNPKIFSRRKKLWDSKPLSKFSGEWIDFQGHQIPAEYKTEAERNPEVFKRDFMAMPSLVLEPYVKQMDLVRKQIDPQRQHPLDANNKFLPWFYGNANYTYYLHIDLSLTTDRTGIAMCHMEAKKIIVDMMVGIKPPENGEIDYAEIEAMVVALRERKFSIGKCTFDQFQSASAIQTLNKMGFKTEKLSVDTNMDAYETLKEGLYTGKIILYDYPLFFNELERLELKDGNKVDHPPVNHGSKDVTDAVAGAVLNCVRNQNNFMFWSANQTPQTKSQAEVAKAAETQAADGLCRYGQFGIRGYRQL